MMSIRSTVSLPLHGFYQSEECVGAWFLTGLPLAETVIGLIEWMAFCVGYFC